MKQIVAVFLLAAAFGSPVSAQMNPEVVLPQHNDQYSALVKALESGEGGVNYVEFRESFIASKQFLAKRQQQGVYEGLKKEMYAQMREKNYRELIRIAKSMLGIDYTSMVAHKILQQSYGALGDAANQKKYKDIEFALLNSITKNGNGQRCETSWQVVQLEEEFFMLDMLGARKDKQILDRSGGRLCDRLEVTLQDGTTRTLYFGVDKVFSTYEKR